MIIIGLTWLAFSTAEAAATAETTAEIAAR